MSAAVSQQIAELPALHQLGWDAGSAQGSSALWGTGLHFHLWAVLIPVATHCVQQNPEFTNAHVRSEIFAIHSQSRGAIFSDAYD